MTWCPGNKVPCRSIRLCSGGSAAGYTLIELLTVIAIVALIGGLGAGAYQTARRNYALQASAGRIQGILRAARNSALATGNPTFVVLDPIARRASAQAFDRVGEWSFEGLEADDERSVDGGLSASGLPGSGSNRGGQSIVGHVGRGLSFRAPSAHFECGAEPRFDLRTGIVVEAWVRHGETQKIDSRSTSGGSGKRTSPRRGRAAAETSRENTSPAWAILNKDGAYFLGMTSMGAVEGAIGTYRLRTSDGVVSPERWVRVEMRYDGRHLELTVDGVPRAAFPLTGNARTRSDPDLALPGTAPVTAAMLTISDPGLPFPGDIDEVRLAGATEPLEYVWPEHELALGWKQVIHFDRRGHLSDAFHTETIRFVLTETPDEPGPKAVGATAVAVDYSVTFDEWRARFPKPEDVSFAAEMAKLDAAHASSRQVVIAVDRLGVVH